MGRDVIERGGCVEEGQTILIDESFVAVRIKGTDKRWSNKS